jgi:hypothetical protein
MHGNVNPDALDRVRIVGGRHHGRMLQHPPLRRGRHTVVQLDAAAEAGQGISARRPVHQHQVGLGVLEARMAQLERQVAVVGQQQQALAVQVQPAHGIEPHRSLEQRLQPRPAARVVEHRQHARGFVEHQIAAPGRRPRLDQLAIDAHLVLLRVHLDAQFRDHRAIDRHAAGLDHLVAGPPRGDPRVGHYLVQSFLRHARS